MPNKVMQNIIKNDTPNTTKLDGKSIENTFIIEIKDGLPRSLFSWLRQSIPNLGTFRIRYLDRFSICNLIIVYHHISIDINGLFLFQKVK